MTKELTWEEAITTDGVFAMRCDVCDKKYIHYPTQEQLDYGLTQDTMTCKECSGERITNRLWCMECGITNVEGADVRVVYSSDEDNPVEAFCTSCLSEYDEPIIQVEIAVVKRPNCTCHKESLFMDNVGECEWCHFVGEDNKLWIASECELCKAWFTDEVKDNEHGGVNTPRYCSSCIEEQGIVNHNYA